MHITPKFLNRPNVIVTPKLLLRTLRSAPLKRSVSLVSVVVVLSVFLWSSNAPLGFRYVPSLFIKRKTVLTCLFFLCRLRASCIHVPPVPPLVPPSFIVVILPQSFVPSLCFLFTRFCWSSSLMMGWCGGRMPSLIQEIFFSWKKGEFDSFHI
ncbi:hypothetical protein NE237_020513 [Protea cynaroides]|uniref:Transmembrane protein n=1 Tax=Protea cynaroides TaxID=273540 RepID=A0A9Q0K3Z3_9MAGN|nr:hypothetical protein NE237_020513 [Protea cynaroides]